MDVVVGKYYNFRDHVIKVTDIPSHADNDQKMVCYEDIDARGEFVISYEDFTAEFSRNRFSKSSKIVNKSRKNDVTSNQESKEVEAKDIKQSAGKSNQDSGEYKVDDIYYGTPEYNKLCDTFREYVNEYLSKRITGEPIEWDDFYTYGYEIIKYMASLGLNVVIPKPHITIRMLNFIFTDNNIEYGFITERIGKYSKPKICKREEYLAWEKQREERFQEYLKEEYKKG